MEPAWIRIRRPALLLVAQIAQRWQDDTGSCTQKQAEEGSSGLLIGWLAGEGELDTFLGASPKLCQKSNPCFQMSIRVRGAVMCKGGGE